MLEIPEDHQLIILVIDGRKSGKLRLVLSEKQMEGTNRTRAIC